MNSPSFVANPQPRIRICAVIECNRPIGQRRSKYCSENCQLLQGKRNQQIRYEKKRKFFPETRICIFDGCNKVFVTHFWNQVYCSEKCLNLNRKFLLKQKIIKKYGYDSVCLWCHKQTEFVPTKKFCGEHECSYQYITIKNRIQNIYSFDNKSVDRELQRLEKLGKNYTFPKPHQQLNLFYQLKGEPEKCLT